MNVRQVELRHAKYLFYDLHLDNNKISDNIHKELKPFSAKSILLVGCPGLAKELTSKGFDVTILLTSEDMKRYVQNSLPFLKTILKDITAIGTMNTKFDAVVCLGATFSNLINDKDVQSAISNFYGMLKYGGIILLENLKDSKVRESNDSITKIENNELKIKRMSKILPTSDNPPTALWNETYELMQDGKRNIYEESSKIRGYSEDYMRKLMAFHNFQVVKTMESSKGHNFLTLARK